MELELDPGQELWEEMDMFALEPEEFESCPVCNARINGLIYHEDGIWRCPRCYSAAEVISGIKVIAFNREDNCPFEVAMAWVGLFLLAAKNENPILDEFGRWISGKGTYEVWMYEAVQLLQEVFPGALEWYASENPNLEGCIYLRKWEVEDVVTFTIIDPDTCVRSSMIEEIVQNQAACLDGTDFGQAYAGL